MSDQKNNLIAHYKGGGSDKVYLACVRKDSIGWAVIGKYGRRGRNLQSQMKASGLDEFKARSEQQKLFRSKLKKGTYKDVEADPTYSGPVTRTCDAVAPFLEPENPDVTQVIPATPPVTPPVPPTPPPSPPEPEDIVVKCVDDLGIEDRFDQGIDYIAEDHSDTDMIWVYDRFGEKGEFFKTRFKRV